MARKRKLLAGESNKQASTSNDPPVPKKIHKVSDEPTESVNTRPGLKLGTVLEPTKSDDEDSSSDEDTSPPVESSETAKDEQLTMDFSSNELPKAVGDTLDSLLSKTTDLQLLVDRWVKMTPSERSVHFSDPLEEERISLWIMNALVSLGEVYCRMQGLDPEKEGFDKRKDLLNRYAYKFDELEPHSHLLSKVDGGPTSRLDMPAVKRFLKSALVEDGNSEPTTKQLVI